MEWPEDYLDKNICVTSERSEHIETEQPEAADELADIGQTVIVPDAVVQSFDDTREELFYRKP